MKIVAVRYPRLAVAAAAGCAALYSVWLLALAREARSPTLGVVRHRWESSPVALNEVDNMRILPAPVQVGKVENVVDSRAVDSKSLAQIPATVPLPLPRPASPSKKPYNPADNKPLVPIPIPPPPAPPRNLPDACSAFLHHAASPPPQSQPSQPDQYLPETIFFLHYTRNLTHPRYLCALESALRQNPRHELTLLAADPHSLASGMRAWMDALHSRDRTRLRLEVLDWAAAFRGTPLQAWYEGGAYSDSSWVDQNLGNAARMAVLWKRGGTYLDLDLGDAFLWAMMEEFVDGYKGHIWARNGPRMVTRTYNKYCGKELAQAHAMCDGLIVLPPEKFFPVQYEQREKLFAAFEDSCDWMQRMTQESIGIHWWNKRIAGHQVNTRTALHVLLESNCPVLFGGSAFDVADLGASMDAPLGVVPEGVKGVDPALAYNRSKNKGTGR
ncbi:alpha 1,4-glycosyltransferase conserved region-domain-containing protein [Chytriomyces sp. MP71]|nr:alpha 1,4-glycosyltransferase conserved region-domain-containing protein [Chytriomyces sp. MP71]